MDWLKIHSTKWDGSPHWKHEVVLLEQGEWGWLTFQDRGWMVESRSRTWLTNHRCLRWLWRERWWDALLLFDDEGRWLEWYCNILTPPRQESDTLRFQDLDLDVVWHRDFGIRIADGDEFERHAVGMRYPPSLIQQVWDSAQAVRAMMQRGAWRFGTDPRTLRFEEEIAPWRDRLT